MKRFYIIFKGQVQGVGFRWTAAQIAYKYNLTGWVRNLDDGDVELQIQGNENELYQALKELQTSRRYIIIDDYFVKETKTIEETTFDIKF